MYSKEENNKFLKEKMIELVSLSRTYQGLDKEMSPEDEKRAKELMHAVVEIERSIPEDFQHPDDAGEYGTQRDNRLGNFLQDVYRAETTKIVPESLHRAATGLSEGVPSDGGFMVGSDTGPFIGSVFQTGKLAKLCRTFTISSNSNSLKINAVDETSRATGSRLGGAVSYWLDEAGEKTASKPKFRQINMTLNKLIGLCYTSDELLQDVDILTDIIDSSFRSEFGFKTDDGIINGTGAGQMLGILNASCLVSVSAEVGQASNTILAENIEKMWARLLPDSQMRAVWLINPAVWPQLFQLHHTVGAGGVPVFVPGGNLDSAPYGNLLGRPIMPIEQCSALGTQGDVIAADLQHYLLAEKGNIKRDVSIHVRYVYDESCFRFVSRLDGQPDMASAITPYKGSDTLSPFVALASR